MELFVPFSLQLSLSPALCSFRDDKICFSHYENSNLLSMLKHTVIIASYLWTICLLYDSFLLFSLHMYSVVVCVPFCSLLFYPSTCSRCQFSRQSHQTRKWQNMERARKLRYSFDIRCHLLNTSIEFWIKASEERTKVETMASDSFPLLAISSTNYMMDTAFLFIFPNMA